MLPEIKLKFNNNNNIVYYNLLSNTFTTHLRGYPYTQNWKYYRDYNSDNCNFLNYSGVIRQ